MCHRLGTQLAFQHLLTLTPNVSSHLCSQRWGGGESASKVSSCNKIGGGNAQTGLVLEVGSKHCLQEWPLVKQL